MAGGIGITPIFGMAHALERHGRPFRAALRGAHARADAVPRTASELLGDRLELFVSAEGNRLDLGAEIERLHPDGELYLCGPLRLRDAAQRAWRDRERRAGPPAVRDLRLRRRFAPEEFIVHVRDHGPEVTVRSKPHAARRAARTTAWR